jgi:hypothetical protein
MSDQEQSVDELGPVDYIVVEFPGSQFDGSIATVLADLVDRGIIRVLDVILIAKGDDGEIDVLEVSDFDDSALDELRRFETEIALLLSEDDVVNLAGAVDPGTTAAVLVYENTWAAPFGAAVRHRGGQLVASGRIPIQALLAAIEEDEDADVNGETE